MSYLNELRNWLNHYECPECGASCSPAESEWIGDCFIVTGSIGPHFEPLLFRRKADAAAYARHIDRCGRLVHPRFAPVIETRWASDMFRFAVLERFDVSSVWTGVTHGEER
ncbi:hypothetical protein ACV35Z_29595 [Pseudomonas aeruginosa]|nr:hypothetical protein [Pseudomonas aeruginosa]